MMLNPRYRSPSRRPWWIIVSASLFLLLVIGSYIHSLRGYTSCHIFSSNVCGSMKHWRPPAPVREWNDEELFAHSVIKEVLSVHTVSSKTPKIAFMFLTPGSLPFEKLWEKFFQGHEGMFSIYVHASHEKPIHTSPVFFNSEILSDKVLSGKVSIVDAERRLLVSAFQDPDNQQFLLLSDSCIPLHNFDYIYRYFVETNKSFVDCFEDPGPHGSGRYSENMMPEIEKSNFRKGSQWFSIKRKHAFLFLADNLYYTKFKLYCQPNMNGRHCYADEHYLPTFLNMVDPTGISNWSVTHVDWSEGKWRPKAYTARDVTFELLKNISLLDESTHVTSDRKRVVTRKPCLWNGTKRPCFLFASKFYPEALPNLENLLSHIHSVEHFA